MPFIGQFDLLDSDKYRKLAQCNNFFCIDVGENSERFANSFSDILPFVWLSGYLKFAGHPVFAAENFNVDESLPKLAPFLDQLRHHGYDSFYLLTHDRNSGRLIQIQNGRPICPTIELAECAVLATCTSPGDVISAIEALEKRWSGFLARQELSPTQLSNILVKVDEARISAQKLLDAYHAVLTSKRHIYQLQSNSHASEVQSHYDRVYEAMPLWYKKLGGLLRRLKFTFSR